MKKNSFLTSLLAAAVLAATNFVFAADRTIVKDGETINIQDKTYSNIQYEGAGGAVYNTGKLTIDNAVFKDNSALTVTGTETYPRSEGKGGAIYNAGDKGAELSITNSTFENNNSADGGAIYNEGTINVIKASTFTGNNASHEVQGFTYSSADDNIITISTSNSGGYGGAIYNENADINIENNSFENNTAESGGAIANRGTAVIKNSEFSNNKSNSLISGKTTYTHNGEEYTKDISWYNGLGGAIYNNGDLLVENSTFSGNLAAYSGGAIYSDSGNVTIKNSNFINNTAKSETVEGYFRLNEQGEVEYVDESCIDGIGGALSIAGSGHLTVGDSLFEGNIAGGEGGGAISAWSTIANITNSTFTSNSTTGNGGAIYSMSDAVNVTNSTFTGNKADGGIVQDYTSEVGTGGAIYHEGDNLTVKNSIFTDNSALVKRVQANEAGTTESYLGSGGAIYNTGDNLLIENSTFESNESVFGGAVSGNGILTVNNSKFHNNTAKKEYSYKSAEDPDKYYENDYDGSGGAIDNNGDVKITGSEFAGNQAAAEGGAIAAWNGNITVNDSVFKNNSAKYYSENTIQEEYNGYFGDGGAIFGFSNDNITIANSVFEGNASGASRGAVAFYNGNNANITNSTFTSNSTTGNGGAVAFSGQTLNITDTDFINNTAKQGGAIYRDSGNLNIKRTSFENNTTEANGGAINLQPDFKYTNPENQEMPSGGFTLAQTTIADSTFNGNSSAEKGGAIYANSAPVRIVDTNFTNNSAKEGGAVYTGYNGDLADLVIVLDELGVEMGTRITALNKDVKFSGNKADKGADIYLENNKLYLNANEGKTISFDGGITGKNSVIDINNSSVNDLYENLSSVGKIIVDNFVSPDENSALAVNLKAGTLALTKDNYLDRTDLTLEEGSLLDLANNNVGGMNLNSLTSNNANLKIDMNLASSDQIFDTIKATTATGTLNLKNVNIMSDFADTTKNEYTASITPDGMELKTPENGINTLTNDYIYTIKAKDNNLTVNRLADENGEALKTDGFTVAVNQTDKVGGVDVALSDDRVFSANSDIKITGTNSETGWTGELGGKSLTVNGNGYTLDGEDNVGFAINNGQTLSFNDTNIKGFAPVPERKGALTVNDGGAVNINASNNDISLGNNSDTDVIYLDGTTSKAFLNTQNGKGITVNDKISSANSANELRLNGDGNISFNNKVQQLTLTNENTNTIHNTYVDGVNYNLNNGTVSFTKDEYLNGQGNKNTLNFNGGTLNLANNAVGTIDLAAININSNSNIMLDADLAKETMDKITADSATANKDAILNVSEINLLSDAAKDKVEINAVEPSVMLGENDSLASHIGTTVTEVAYSPIYKYGVGYNPSTGNFTFSRGSSENYNNINPSVMTGPVAAQLGGYVSMLDTYNNAFNNMDMRMLNPASVRLAQKQANRYAITEEADSVTYKVNETNSGGTWVRPFASYDSVGLKNGPSVGSFSYGTFIGGDSGIHQFKNGGEGVLSAHVSYLGSHQSFNGNSIYQNGGNLGLTGTYYKGNFFTGLTVNAGASVADASTRYGSEDFPMFMAGVANKTGYNFEFKDGKFIIQPSLLLSYTFVNTFDYTNAAGVSINGDPLHALQISPNVRFALNTRNGWQPYLTAGMNWNIMNDSQFTANMATLPDLSMKPYVQYGLGIQQTINDNFTAYGQVLIRNGGRNGIAANAGLRYIFGHETKPNENI